MLTILFWLVNNKTLMLVMDRTYKFTIGMKILHLTYFNDAQMDVLF